MTQQKKPSILAENRLLKSLLRKCYAADKIMINHFYKSRYEEFKAALEEISKDQDVYGDNCLVPSRTAKIATKALGSLTPREKK